MKRTEQSKFSQPGADTCDTSSATNVITSLALTNFYIRHIHNSYEYLRLLIQNKTDVGLYQVFYTGNTFGNRNCIYANKSMF